MTRDDIYSLPLNQVGSFEFDEQVVSVFPDMIARSVPGYASILSMIEQLAARFVRPGTTGLGSRMFAGCCHAVDPTAGTVGLHNSRGG